MKQTAFIFSAFLFGCMSVSEPQTALDTNQFAGIKNGKLIYEGELSEESNKALFEAFEFATNKPERLLISSVGGDLDLGIELGRWVAKNQLDVEVTDVCASSCANYIFTAAKTKYLRKDSVLIWHGSAWQEHWDIDEEYQEVFKQYLARVRAEETEFFTSLEVDNALCIYGQSEINFFDKLFNDYIGFDYSLEDLSKFGINNISLIDNEWDWRKYNPNKSKKVKRIKLNDDYKFKLRRFEV